jgi:hypothetical protein
MRMGSGPLLVASEPGLRVAGGPGQGLWENAVGQAETLMGCEPAGVTGRPCDLPGCVESANR